MATVSSNESVGWDLLCTHYAGWEGRRFGCWRPGSQKCIIRILLRIVAEMNEPAPPPPPTSTLPLLVAAKPPSVTLAGKSCYPSGAFGAPPTSPRKKLTLPHFTSSNGADFQSPRRRHYQSNPERFEPQDPRTTPLEKAIEELRHAKVRASVHQDGIVWQLKCCYCLSLCRTASTRALSASTRPKSSSSRNWATQMR